MRLKVLLPIKVYVDEEVTKIRAKAENGFFGILPRHVDFVAALAPGILSFETAAGEEVFMAVDEGILVKYGADVLVSTRHAMRSSDLGRLRQIVEEEFQALDEWERKARSALARLEANFVQHFMEIEEGRL
ncbi:MAG TPA: F0F1 ATP synthase subunit epsilon [Anaerolineae bacterium]|jgi:F-type H+-transporting ATPase subunit epsilon